MLLYKALLVKQSLETFEGRKAGLGMRDAHTGGYVNYELRISKRIFKCF
jgi:hypothetical protein